MKLLIQVLVAANLAFACTATFMRPPFAMSAKGRVPYPGYSMSRFSAHQVRPAAPLAPSAFGPMPARMASPPVPGMTPALTWYVPNGKCPDKWYCRAQLTMYGRFDGSTEVRAGFSAWFFEAPSAPIPQYALHATASIVQPEIIQYTDALMPMVMQGFPGNGCPLDAGAVDKAFSEASQKFANECHETTDMVCEKDVSVMIC